MVGNTLKSASRLAKFVTIRNSLFLLVAVLVMAIVASNILGAVDALKERATAQEVVSHNEVADLLLTSDENWSAERGYVAAALGDSSPISSQRFSEIQERRRAADEAYREAMEKLVDTKHFMVKEELMSALEEEFSNMQALRGEADAAMRVAEDQRGRRVGRNWFRGATSLIEASQRLRKGVEHSTNVTEPTIALYSRLKDALATMAEYAGQESAVIGPHIASGQPLSSIRLEILQNYRGHLDQAWEDAQQMAETDLVSDDVRAAMEEARKVFFTDFAELRESVYTAAIIEEPYPVSAEEWLSRANSAAGALLKIGEIAGAETRAMAESDSAAATGSLIFQVGVLVVVLAIGVAAFWSVALWIVRPIVKMTEAMKRLAEGELEVEIVGVGRGDEIGQMASSMEVFKDNAIERQRLREEQAAAEEARRETEEQRHREEEEARVREEERKEREREERQQEMLALADKFEQSVMGVVSAVSKASNEMQTAAQNMVAIAEDTTRQAGAVASASQQANHNVQTVASAAEELSSSVREITSQVDQSTRYARTAVTETDGANDEIQGLAEAAQRIGDVVSLINDIASQTNLLALNATIEASRAGEAGKGFAVVASEVKNLANQTAKATEEITSQISEMQAATEKAVTAIGGINKTIKQIDEVAVAIASAVEQQDASTQEIARNVVEASTGTEEVSRNIAIVNEGASNTGAAAGQVLTAAQEMSRQSEELHETVSNFLSQVRSA